MSDTETRAGPAAEGEALEAAPRDLRKERAALMRKLTPLCRKWLRMLPAHHFQKWKAAKVLGVSTHTVFKWMRRDDVKAALALLEEIDELDSDVTRQRILAAYEAIACADIRKLYNENGTLKEPSEWPDDIAVAVESVETVERKLYEGDKAIGLEYVRKVHRHNKKFALEFLAAHRKMAASAKRFELTGKDGTPLAQPVPVVNVIIDGAAKPPAALTPG